MTMRVGLTARLMVVIASLGIGQSSITERQVREWAAAAAAQANGDVGVFDETFKNSVRTVAEAYWPDKAIPAQRVYSSSSLDIWVVGPVAAFQISARNRVRRLESLADVLWPCGVQVQVIVNQIDAPDVDKIVVKRGDQIVAPLKSSLTAEPFTTRAGVTVLRHAGAVCYSPDVFSSGPPVTVTAIPVDGANMQITLNDNQLKGII
jgi:hypothetical protein